MTIKAKFHDVEERAYPPFDDWTRNTITAHSKGQHKYPFTFALNQEIEGLIKRWERVVYLQGGFQEVNLNVSHRSFSMKVESYEMWTHTMAGRVQVQINANDGRGSKLTFICDEDAAYPRAGLSRIEGDLDAIHTAVHAICDAWIRGERPYQKDSTISPG